MSTTLRVSTPSAVPGEVQLFSERWSNLDSWRGSGWEAKGTGSARKIESAITGASLVRDIPGVTRVVVANPNGVGVSFQDSGGVVLGGVNTTADALYLYTADKTVPLPPGSKGSYTVTFQSGQMFLQARGRTVAVPFTSAVASMQISATDTPASVGGIDVFKGGE